MITAAIDRGSFGRLWRAATASATATVFVLAAFEGGTRLAGIHLPAIATTGESDRGLWIHDRSKGWFHAPGTHGRSFMGGPDAGEIHINALGLRGPAVARSKQGARILVFGDSFVFGVGVDEPHLFTSQLERRLNAGATRRYEVVNMGVSGYSTDQEYVLLQELGPRLAPDVVVLVVCDNDFEANTEDFAYHRYHKPWFDLGTDGLLLRNSPVPTLSRLQELKLWLAEHSNTWNLVRTRRTENAWIRCFLELFQVGVVHRSPADPVQLMLSLVAAFKQAADNMGAELIIMNTGHRGERVQLFQALRPGLRKAGIRFLGLEGNLGDARRHDPGRCWDFRQDPHWNVDAHRLAADVVYTYLQERHILARLPR